MGPFLHGDQFAVRFTLDVTQPNGERTVMEEVGVYTVRDGKITEERFFFLPQATA
jgi:ketosteroid isomerase-like protein